MNEEQKAIKDERLKEMMQNYADSYGAVVEVVLDKLNDQISKIGLPAENRGNFILKGIELCNDTAMKIAITIEANRDNLLVKGLDSYAQFIGMLGQGGVELKELQFKIMYEAFKNVFEKGGLSIEALDNPETPEDPETPINPTQEELEKLKASIINEVKGMLDDSQNYIMGVINNLHSNGGS